MPLRFKRQWRDERAKTQEIGRSLRRLGIPPKEVSNAVPCLFRSAIMYKVHEQERALLSIPVSLIILIPYFFILQYQNSKPDESSLLNQLRDSDISSLAVFFLFFILGVWNFLKPPQQKLPEDRRFIKNQVLQTRGGQVSLINIYFNMVAPLFGWQVRQVHRSSFRLVGLLGIVMFGGFGAILVFTVDPRKLWYVGVDAALIALYFIFIMYLSFRLLDAFFRWRLPADVALVHELRVAYTLASSGKAGEWRSFAYRRQIAAHLSQAASILEGSMLRIIPASEGGTAKAIVQSNIKTVAAGLREKFSWLITPKPDTPEHLARAIGEILVVAATGNLDGLVGLGTDATSDVHFGWQGQLSAVGRWAIVALGPGVAVLLGWHSVTDPAIRTLAVQFAAICFLNATFSAVVQRGDDRLSSIVSIGSSVFGWGKPKG